MYFSKMTLRNMRLVSPPSDGHLFASAGLPLRGQSHEIFLLGKVFFSLLRVTFGYPHYNLCISEIEKGEKTWLRPGQVQWV